MNKMKKKQAVFESIDTSPVTLELYYKGCPIRVDTVVTDKGLLISKLRKMMFNQLEQLVFKQILLIEGEMDYETTKL